MGLDKWLKPKEPIKKPKAKKVTPSKDLKISSERNLKTVLEKPYSKLTKYNLTCTNSKCKYQKTIMKKQLTERDKICPRCKKEMIIK